METLCFKPKREVKTEGLGIGGTEATGAGTGAGSGNV